MEVLNSPFCSASLSVLSSPPCSTGSGKMPEQFWRDRKILLSHWCGPIIVSFLFTYKAGSQNGQNCLLTLYRPNDAKKKKIAGKKKKKSQDP